MIGDIETDKNSNILNHALISIEYVTKQPLKHRIWKSKGVFSAELPQMELLPFYLPILYF